MGLPSGFRRSPVPALLSCGCSSQGCPRAWLFKFTAVLRNSLSTPDLGVWGTAAWTGRHTGVILISRGGGICSWSCQGRLFVLPALSFRPLIKGPKHRAVKVAIKAEEMLVQLAYQSSSQTPARFPYFKFISPPLLSLRRCLVNS